MTDRGGGARDKNNNNTLSSSKVINEGGQGHHFSAQGRLSHEENSPNDTFTKRYKVIEKIGEGSYSEVLKCQSRHDGSVVACKRLKHTYRSLDDVTNISEIATLRSIQKHSNILQMLEIHYDKALGKVSLVFELMDINLYELIKDRKRLLPESRVRAIMFQLFRALRHLHKLGVFHRDIKPENILIRTKTDQLKLGDLGSVRGMFSRPPYTEYISTRWYRSPECLLTAGHYSHKMDVWAAGCVFYEVLTLRPLFPGSSEIDQINRINNVLGPPPVKLLDTFQKQAELEKDTYRGQSQLTRRQQIQKILNGYSSRYGLEGGAKPGGGSGSSLKAHRREFIFGGKEGTGLDKILPAHVTREAKEIIKNCLLYDPEQRPTANRIVQLAYFSELRDSYSKNPDKVSTKTVVLICDDTVTHHSAPIELGTLGDHKVRYRRGIALKPSGTGLGLNKKTTTMTSSSSKATLEKVASSLGKKLEGVAASRKLSSDSAEMKPSLTRIPGKGKSGENLGKVARKTASFTKSTAENRNGGGRRGKEVPPQQNLIKIPSKPKNSQGSFQSQKLAEISRKKQILSSSTSEDVSETPPRRKQALQEAQPQPETVSPYVKPPQELKFLRNKIKIDQAPRKKDPQLPPAPPNPSTSGRVSVVPPKVAAAAIKYVKNSGNRSKPREALSNSFENPPDTTSVEGIPPGKKMGAGESLFSDLNDDTASYATNSSIKIGKLRFRQGHGSSQASNSLRIPSKTETSVVRSKIPVPHDDLLNSPVSRRSTRLTTSPPADRRDSELEKWRNTSIPRRIPMSPERERSIKLLKDSLTMDKNKRVKLIRYNSDNDPPKQPSLQEHPSSGGFKNYDYTSQDAHTANFSSGGGPGGRYRHTTTEYENPDLPETSSPSAQALESHQKNLFNASRKGKLIMTPSGGEEARKQSEVNKNGGMYPPEMLNLYSSRYRGPNINMSILKDHGNSYGKRSSDASHRAPDVKDKINQKLEQRRRLEAHMASNSQENQQKAFETRRQFGGEDDEGVINRRRPPLPPGGCSTGKIVENRRILREISPSQSQISLENKAESGRSSSRRLLGKVTPAGDQIRKELKENLRKKEERLRSNLRDDVFCSSDDDVVISMRKKFDSLISERARKLSESLNESLKPSRTSQFHRKYPDSGSDDDDPGLSSISRRSRAEKSKKYARRELRARMAESLTMSGIGDEKYSHGGLGGVGGNSLVDRVSNESGDWIDSFTKYPEKNQIFSDSRPIWGRTGEELFHEGGATLQSLKRIHPFPIQDHSQYRTGQIFTPPSNKPAYQVPPGGFLQDRKIRYSHAQPTSLSSSYLTPPGGSRRSSKQLEKK